jgi:precorrin-6A synthase
VTRRIRIIGIGAGNPDHMTVQAINALNACDVLFLPTKGEEKAFLADIRREICGRFITGAQPRILEFPVPRRRADGDYGAGVTDWHVAIAVIYEQMLLEAVGEDETVGLLVWGDPMLYDSTIRIVEHVRIGGRVAFDYDVIPGITSLQALCASHRIPLNRIGLPVEITTGRRLAEGWPESARDVAVMLDGVQAFETVADPDAVIHWGAYLGTPMEITLTGRLSEIAGTIGETRKAARAEHGWIMDTYLIRRPVESGEEGAE